MEFNKVLEKRTSRRRYSSKKPELEQVMELIAAANLAPSPGNLQILRYVLVEDEKQIEKIAEACQQDFVSKAQILVVVCSESKNVERAYDKRTKRYIKQHAGAAIENFLLKATDMGLASCWVGAFTEFSIKNVLTIPDEVDVEAVLPVGNILITDRTKQKRKPELYERIWFGRYGNKYQKPFRTAYEG